MITLGNMLLPAIMLFSPYPLLSCPKFFWASYADEFIIYWFHCLLIEPPTLSGLETHAADEHSPLLMENSLLAVKRRVLFCFFFTPLHYLSPLCFYLFNTSFTFYHLFLPLPPKCSEKQAKKLLAWFLKACFALIEQMALKGSLSLICWDLGRGPNPAGFCNSLILRHQVGIGSGQSLLCHATLLLSSLPPCPIGALAKERKPVWVGSSSCVFFFFPPPRSQVTWMSYSAYWTFCVQLFKLKASLSSPAMRKLPGGVGAGVLPLPWHGGGTMVLLRLAWEVQDCSASDHAGAGPGTAGPRLSAHAPRSWKHPPCGMIIHPMESFLLLELGRRKPRKGRAVQCAFCGINTWPSYVSGQVDVPSNYSQEERL